MITDAQMRSLMKLKQTEKNVVDCGGKGRNKREHGSQIYPVKRAAQPEKR